MMFCVKSMGMGKHCYLWGIMKNKPVYRVLELSSGTSGTKDGSLATS